MAGLDASGRAQTGFLKGHAECAVRVRVRGVAGARRVFTVGPTGGPETLSQAPLLPHTLLAKPGAACTRSSVTSLAKGLDTVAPRK